ncbi:ACP S-malonyltransferase [Streptomyces specialis]|uniref:ACP S-malonyltransferase n=1 Tax=Streptomyces specialis TaxID=498367 RepID=UPI00099ED3BA|nr:ACP S-malonyltransferase [Streptomyces specialis]
MTPTAWLFPGQGSQHRGMGRELFDRHPGIVAAADAVLGYPVRDLCLDDPGGRLSDTRYAQPALYVVNALAAAERAGREPEPDWLAGHSLGEYNALLAAGAFDFETGLRLVARRGELMSRAAGGGMTAVVGPDAEKVPAALAEAGVDGVDVANRNSPEQIVLSGPVEALRAATAVVRAAGLGRCVPLRVGAAFHSRWMADAAREYAAFLAGWRFADPRIPVVANATARPYEAGSVARLLGEQVAAPVRWSESMRLLLERGVRDPAEVGPGSTLRGLWRATASAAPAAPAVTAPAAPAVTAPVVPVAAAAPRVTAGALGSAAFRRDYGLRYAYLAGSMYRGIASTELVIRLAEAGLMGFFGTGGLAPGRIEDALRTLRAALGPGGRFGMNLLHSLDDPALEDATVALFLRHDVRFVEAAGFTRLTPALVRYRLSGAHRAPDGTAVSRRRVLAKVSRPEVAAAFLGPAPGALLDRLVAEGALTAAEADAGRDLPVGEEICVESDSGGHTDQGVALALLPAMLRLRDRVARESRSGRAARVGASGGLGTPESVAAAFVLGADFVMTGSVNQCTVEAGTSELVKDMLAGAGVQDTAYAPAGDMFEAGARVQVLRRGTLFPARANKLYQLYRTTAGLGDLTAGQTRALEETVFRRGLDEVWRLARDHYLRTGRPQEAERAERDPRHRMALVFRWWFAHTTRAAIEGAADEKVNFQIHTGPAIGAFNAFAAGTPLENWRNRHVDSVAEALMTGAAEVLDSRLRAFSAASATPAQ